MKGQADPQTGPELESDWQPGPREDVISWLVGGDRRDVHLSVGLHAPVASTVRGVSAVRQASAGTLELTEPGTICQK